MPKPTLTSGLDDADVCVTDRRRGNRRSETPTRRPSKTAFRKPRPDAKRTTKPKADSDDEDRRSVDRRRQIDPTTCERDYKPDEVEFMTAMDDYKRRSGRPFPTWSEVLEVLRDLGYRKVAAATQTYTPEAT